jgi:hypothetical protein
MSEHEQDRAANEDRRAFMSTFGKVALVAPPVITAMLATSMSSPAIAQSTGGSKGNNGVGNGIDPQPPGNPPVNDGPGTGPGNPGSKGGAHGLSAVKTGAAKGGKGRP